jgi:hypothetical protein
MTRDSWLWIIAIVAGVATGLASNFALFPWIPAPWQHGIAIVAFIGAIVAGKLSMSPLPLSAVGQVQANAGNLGTPQTDASKNV